MRFHRRIRERVAHHSGELAEIDMNCAHLHRPCLRLFHFFLRAASTRLMAIGSSCIDGTLYHAAAALPADLRNTSVFDQHGDHLLPGRDRVQQSQRCDVRFHVVFDEIIALEWSHWRISLV